MYAYCGNNPCNGVDPSGCYRTYYRTTIYQGENGGVGAGIPTGYLLYQLYLSAKDAAKQLAEELHAILVSEYPPKGDYTVYFLCAQGDISRTIIYVGRVKTENFQSRMNYHRSMGRQYVDSISNLNYAACRAIEQGGMMYYHTINRNSELGNKIRGIGVSNSNRHLYFVLIQEMISNNLYPDNSLLPLSYWGNLTENEFLNMLP